MTEWRDGHHDSFLLNHQHEGFLVRRAFGPPHQLTKVWNGLWQGHLIFVVIAL